MIKILAILFLCVFCVAQASAASQIPQSRKIVVFGDSILHAMLEKDPKTHENYFYPITKRLKDKQSLLLVNKALSGNPLLGSYYPATGEGRFQTEALVYPDATHIIFLMGTNDIVPPGTKNGEALKPASAQSLIDGYKRVIGMAHHAGKKIIGGTVLPFKGAYLDHDLKNQGPGYLFKDKEHERQIVNQWIRTSGSFDGVMDFDAALRDPKDPEQIKPELTKDHIHPNEKGLHLMAKAVNPTLLEVGPISWWSRLKAVLWR